MTARIELGRADLALLTSPVATRVHIPSLMAMPRTREQEGTEVRFDGDAWPTSFDGEGRVGTFDLTCRYSAKQRALRVGLEYLVDEVARTAFDKRLLLRTHIEPATDLPAAMQAFVAAGSAVAVRVRRLVTTPVNANVMDVTFTATIVQHRWDA